MMKLTNRILERATGFSHPQIKRWAVAFIDPDPWTGQHSGKARNYTLDEAISIYIGGFLVDKFRFSLRDVSTILADIETWLEGQGWLFYKQKGNSRNLEINIESILTRFSSLDLEELIVTIDRCKNVYCYRVKEIIELRGIPDPQDDRKSIYEEKYRIHYFGDKSESIPSDRGGELHLSRMIINLAKRLKILCSESG